MDEFNTLVIIGCSMGRTDNKEAGLQSPERISEKASRFLHGVPGLGGHGFIMQASSGTFRQLYADQPALIIVRRGTKRISSVLGDYEAHAGRAVVLPAGRAWTVVNETAGPEGYQADAFAFAPQLVQDYADRRATPLKDAATFTPDWAMEEALRRLCRTLADPGATSPLLRHLFGEIVIRLEAHGFNLTPGNPTSLQDRVRALVGNDVSGDWSASRMTAALGMSEASLRRKLAASGSSLSEIITDVRMTRALALLQTTELPINQVALDVGYGSASKFAARFRQRFGLSPREIRVREDDSDRGGAEVDRLGAAAE
jgi:AraC-like DNA-binding protein